MKALSVWEPWASLIRTGAKAWETRTWGTSYRGTLLICAAKKGLPQRDLEHLLRQWQFRAGLAPLVGLPLATDSLAIAMSDSRPPFIHISHLNYGHAVAVVRLIDCIPTHLIEMGEMGMEQRFGDFSRGRWGWHLELLKAIEPFPVKGKQGLFDLEYDLDVEE